MPTPDAIVRQWFDEVWNGQQAEAVDRLMAADAMIHGLAETAAVGPDAFKPFQRAFLDAFPDLRIEVLRTVTEGDIVVTHIRTTGVHSGEGLGFPPTNKPVKMHGMVIARIRNGQIAEGWNCIDFLTMYQQLGVVSNPVGQA